MNDLTHRWLGRRQFLKGAGALLLLPPLRSLMLPSAAAQVSAPKRRFVVWLSTNGINQEFIFPPNQNDLTPVAGVYSANTKPLSAFSGPISRMIDTDFAPLYPKMNLIQGLSMVGADGFYGHNSTVLSGTLSPYDTGNTFGRTLDVVMEKSPGVYGPGSAVPFKAVRVGTGTLGRDDRSFTYDGKVASDCLLGDVPMFNQLFSQLTGGTGSPMASDDALIVDKVYADLKALQGNARLSSRDKVVLDQFISATFDLQRKVTAQMTVSCTRPALPLQATKSAYYLPDTEWGNSPTLSSSVMFDNINTMIQLAFACDLTRVVYVGNARCNRDNNVSVDTHHGAPGGAQGAADSQKWGLKKFLSLAKLLDSTPDGGGTLLDSSGMLYTNEMGDWTTDHNIFNIPTVTLGSLAGALRTGYFMDFRQRPFRDAGTGYWVGRPHKQLLQAFMQGMGVPKAEYLQFGDGHGYGEFCPTAKGVAVYSVFQNEHNEPLPFFFKG
ncbi:MAG: DUF1552 domain-containing protein [Archangiaceae bacterium]|nr:DUF1552 domain-containing protein [Archangiaceae bacterium]